MRPMPSVVYVGGQPQQAVVSPQNVNQEITAPPYETNSVDIVKEMLDPTKTLLTIELRLKGYRQRSTPKGWVWEAPEKESINAELLDKIMVEIESRVNPVMMLSDLSEEEAHKICLACSLAVNDLLFIDGEKYGINPDSASRIVNMVDDLVLSSCKRAVGHQEKKFWGKTAERKETFTPSQQTPRKRSLLKW